MSGMTEAERQIKLAKRRETARKRRETGRPMTSYELSLQNTQASLGRVKMVLTPWVYDEFGNPSRVLYREE